MYVVANSRATVIVLDQTGQYDDLVEFLVNAQENGMLVPPRLVDTFNDLGALYDPEG